MLLDEATKFAIVGLSKAGKTSILKRCFEEHALNEIEKITPTIMIAQDLIRVGHISKRISIWDFGGQKTFRNVYLQNPSYFAKTKILLFVIDVLSSENFGEEREYFGSILKIFEELKKGGTFEPPQMYVFIHKCDPDKKDKINMKVARCLIEMMDLFGTGAHFYITSIYDASACRSLNNILFFSLPEEIISQVFSKEFFEDLKKAISAKIENNPSIEISEVSKIFGDLMGRKLHDLWINSSIKKTDKGRELDEITKSLEIIFENGDERFKLKCPYTRKGKSCPENDCTIVHGFIAGILTSMNLSQRSLKIKHVREKDDCFFIF
jgi:GTPase SAR1 family protein